MRVIRQASVAECIASGVPAGNVRRAGARQPGGPVQLPPGRQHRVDAGRGGHVLLRRRVHAAVRARACDHGRLLRHQDRNTISTFGAINSLNACYINNDPAACDRINRNPNGQLWVGSGHRGGTNINIGAVSTKGWDLNATYSGLEMGRFGSLNFNLTGTLVEELITESGPGIDPFDCVGFYSQNCSANSVGVPTPEWRHRFRTSWVTPWDVDLSLTWRFYDQGRGLRVHDGPHRLRTAGPGLLRYLRELGDHGKGRR